MQKKRKDRYHHGDLRAALVETALALCDEEGADAVTTRAIARRLGVSHAAPARHFPTREDLLTEVAAQAFERFADVLATSMKSRSPRTAMAEMGRAYVRFALDHPGLLHLMFRPESSPAHRRPTGDRAYQVLVEAVKKAVGPNEERVRVHTLLAWSVVHGAALLWLDGPMKGSMSQKEFLALADDVVRASIRAID